MTSLAGAAFVFAALTQSIVASNVRQSWRAVALLAALFALASGRSFAGPAGLLHTVTKGGGKGATTRGGRYRPRVLSPIRSASRQDAMVTRSLDSSTAWPSTET